MLPQDNHDQVMPSVPLCLAVLVSHRLQPHHTQLDKHKVLPV